MQHNLITRVTIPSDSQVRPILKGRELYEVLEFCLLPVVYMGVEQGREGGGQGIDKEMQHFSV